MTNQHLSRYLVFPDDKSRQYLCVCAARDKAHALKIARQNFKLTRTAQAIRETRCTKVAGCE